MGRRDSDERSMACHACVATDGREEGVRYAAREVTAYEPVKESAILRLAVVGKREVKPVIRGCRSRVYGGRTFSNRE